VGSLTDITDPLSPGQMKDLEDIPFQVTYTFEAADFGADFTEIIAMPAGWRGKVKAIDIYNVSETFNSVTTNARVEVGISGGDVDAFAISNDIPDTAANAAFSAVITDGVLPVIPRGTSILIGGIAATGGVPAGIGTLSVTILYFK
jgi:hypothetical protein